VQHGRHLPATPAGQLHLRRPEAGGALVRIDLSCQGNCQGNRRGVSNCAWGTVQTLSSIAATIPIIERIMRTSTRFCQTGSLIAGALIGLSMGGMAFCMTG